MVGKKGAMRGIEKGLEWENYSEKDKFHSAAQVGTSTSSWESKCKWSLTLPATSISLSLD